MTSIDDWIAAREVARCSVLVVLHGDGFQEGVGILFHLDTGRGIRAHFGKTLYAHDGTRDLPSNTKHQSDHVVHHLVHQGGDGVGDGHGGDGSGHGRRRHPQAGGDQDDVFGLGFSSSFFCF